METRLLDSAAVEECAPLSAIVDAVGEAFAAYAEDRAQMPAKSYVDLPAYNGDFRSMPAHVDAEDWEGVGVKWVNVHPDNPADHGLPTVMGQYVYSDPETAFPLAIMDATELTARRTGAAAAVATDHLAIDDADSLGIVGAGAQAYPQLEAIATLREIETVVIADRNPEQQADFVDHFEDRFDVRPGSIEEAAHCDILSTITPVEEPIVQAEWVGERTHVNAMGADAAGKHELADDLLLNARIVVDDVEQAIHSGEINVPFAAGTFTVEDIDSTLGAVVSGKQPGRRAEDGVTIFDSTGLAIQDVAAAHVAYERAIKNDVGTDFALLDVQSRHG